MKKSIHSSEMQRLQHWLKDNRERQGLSMRDVGLRIERPHSFVQKIETGERRLDVVEYLWYCEALGICPQEGIALLLQHIRRER